MDELKIFKNFIYDSNLRDLNIFSKQYFNSILYTIFKNNEDSDVCFTFGDFNKLNELNKKYSMKVGDKALHDSLEIIQFCVPKDTIISRIAGDEFVFLNNNMLKKQMKNYINMINSKLNENKDLTHGLTITMCPVDSNAYSDFEDMYFHSELDVTRKKKKSKYEDLHSKDEILKYKIHENLSNYFSYYRLSKAPLPSEYYTMLRDSIIDLLINNLEKEDENILFYTKRLDSTLSDTNYFSNHYELPLDNAVAIHNAVTSEDFSSLDYETLHDTINFLIRDPLTGQISQKFFNEFLLPDYINDTSSEISVRLFDLAHLKLSNDLIGHNTTDAKINQLFGTLVNQIKNSSTSFKSIISSNGISVLLIEPSNSSIPDNQIERFIESSKRNQRILDIVTAQKTCNSSNILSCINELQDICSNKKDIIKLEKINCKETILPLKMALSDSINYFLENSENPNDIKNKQALTILIFNELANIANEYFHERNPNCFDYR